MLKTISLHWQNAAVDFLFYRYDEESTTADRVAFHEHVNYEMHFAQEGSYCYELSDREILLSRGHMLIIPPHILHRSIKAGPTYRFAALTLKLTAVGEGGSHSYFESLFRSHALQCLPVQDDILHAVFRLQEDVWCEKQDYLYDLYLTHCATDLLYRLCASFAETGGQAAFPVASERHVDVQIENLVNCDHLSLRDIAERVHYSPRQTERLIKKIYGKTLAQIREEQKWRKKQK